MEEIKALELLRDKQFKENENAWEFYGDVWKMLGYNDRYFEMMPEDVIKAIKVDDDSLPYFGDEEIQKADAETLKGMIALCRRAVDVGSMDYAEQGGVGRVFGIAHEKYLKKILDELIKKLKYKNN